MLADVRCYAVVVCHSHYPRIINKGVGVMWAFCRHWVWGVLQQFLESEGYAPFPMTLPQALSFVREELNA